MSAPPALNPIPEFPIIRAQPSAECEVARLCRLIEAAVAAAFAVPLNELRAPTRRSPAAAFARQSAMYLAHVVLGLGYTAIARSFDRDRTTAAHACRLVEERRDDPAIERVLGALEASCASLAGDFSSRREVRA
ncbi:MAG: helix-turn-helix domain-containing protein [Hyphomicrobiales bacterium]